MVKHLHWMFIATCIFSALWLLEVHRLSQMIRLIDLVFSCIHSNYVSKKLFLSPQQFHGLSAGFIVYCELIVVSVMMCNNCNVHREIKTGRFSLLKNLGSKLNLNGQRLVVFIGGWGLSKYMYLHQSLFHVDVTVHIQPLQRVSLLRQSPVRPETS